MKDTDQTLKQTLKGVIKKLNEKGFGFITPEEGGKDVFFHANDCTDGNFTGMQEGDVVTFVLGDSPKGPKATDVVLVAADVAEAA